jgi:hypothetical protein
VLRHEIEIADEQIVVGCFLVDPELRIWASLLIEKEIMERKVEQLDRRRVVF